MKIDIQSYQGNEIAEVIDNLAEFRLRYFREYPYLYVGTKEKEIAHMGEYLANPTARLLIARDETISEKIDGEIVGVAVGTLLSTENDILRQAADKFRERKIESTRYFYFGEMIFVPEYRQRGIGSKMLEILKTKGREQGADRFCFIAVTRESDDPRRPSAYVDSSTIFEKIGFEKTPISTTWRWPTIQSDGSVADIENRLDFWVDRLIIR